MIGQNITRVLRDAGADYKSWDDDTLAEEQIADAILSEMHREQVRAELAGKVGWASALKLVIEWMER